MGNHPTNNDLGEDMAAPLMRAAGSRWIVQKFGGTSIGKFPENIVEDVVRYTGMALIRLSACRADVE